MQCSIKGLKILSEAARNYEILIIIQGVEDVCKSEKQCHYYVVSSVTDMPMAE